MKIRVMFACFYLTYVHLLNSSISWVMTEVVGLFSGPFACFLISWSQNIEFTNSFSKFLRWNMANDQSRYCYCSNTAFGYPVVVLPFPLWVGQHCYFDLLPFMRVYQVMKMLYMILIWLYFSFFIFSWEISWLHLQSIQNLDDCGDYW